MNIIDLFEDEKQLTLKDALKDFLPLVMEYLHLDSLPKIELSRKIGDTKYPTFGRYSTDGSVELDISNRHPIDILRSLAHEIVHYKQDLQDELSHDSGETGSPIENEANSEAGIIMRHFNQRYPKYLNLKPIMFNEGVDLKFNTIALTESEIYQYQNNQINHYIQKYQKFLFQNIQTDQNIHYIQIGPYFQSLH